MIKFIQCILLVGAVISFGWGAEAKPGGQGKLKNNFGFDHCFKTNSGPVYEVCADYTINWKMWSLMGEPVGDYNLAWKLTTITLMDPTRKIKRVYTPPQIPNELKKGVNAIELYIDGSADVNILKSSVMAQHHFNTGIAVKAGEGSSFNVPESPSWEKLFIHGYGCFPNAIGGGTYVDAKTAKEIFAGGITLSGLSLCPKSGVSELSILESAIGKLCEKPGADKEYQFCPKQEEKPKKEKILKKNDTQPSLAESILDGPTTNQPPLNASELLDEQAERPIVQKKLNQEVTNYRYKATPGCKQMMNQINICYKKTGCKIPDSIPSIETCDNIPKRPDWGGVTNCEYTCWDKEMYKNGRKRSSDSLQSVCNTECSDEIASAKDNIERDRAEWDSTYLGLIEKCNVIKKKKQEYSECQSKFSETCNPNHFNKVDDCLDKQVRTNGPTYNDAKKLMQKEWDKRGKTGGPLMNSILD